jgi:hypothetical protein
VILALQRPYIVAGDFQMDGAALRETGWVDAMHGTVCSPYGYTCVSRRSASTIDFFVVEASLAVMVVSVKVSDFVNDIRPHKPVRLVIDGPEKDEWELRLHRPRSFPTRMPVGPSPAPKPDAWAEVHAVLDAHVEGEACDAAYVALASAAEVEVVAAYDVVDDVERLCGRAAVTKVVWQRRKLEKGEASFPRGTAVSRTWRWLGDRLDELVHLRFRTVEW